MKAREQKAPLRPPLRKLDGGLRPLGGKPLSAEAEVDAFLKQAGLGDGFDAAARGAISLLLTDVGKLRRQLSEARDRIAELEQLADEDALMPIANRRAFIRELTRLMALGQRYGAQASIAFFDMNGLKKLNDTYGHAAGDAALLQIARTLIENVRNTDVVGRLGGDEFGVLLVQTDRELAQTKADELAIAISDRPFVWQGETLALSIAVGVYTFNGDEHVGEALEAADRAMYEQKRRMKAERGA